MVESGVAKTSVGSPDLSSLLYEMMTRQIRREPLQLGIGLVSLVDSDLDLNGGRWI